MKFALVDGERRRPEPGLTAECPGCRAPVTAKCGEKRIWHWAHKGNRHCDPWSEHETEWHRGWKGYFPQECQEVIHHAVSGEKHIADVKTPHGLVIEFQHSYLKPEERRAREAFYDQMMWVVDGTRLKRDRPRFSKTHRDWLPLGKSNLYLVPCVENSLPTNWSDCAVPVLFDFTAGNKGVSRITPGGTDLWCLLPGRLSGYAVAVKVTRSGFPKAVLSGELNLEHEERVRKVAECLRLQGATMEMQASRWSRRRRAFLLRGRS